MMGEKSLLIGWYRGNLCLGVCAFFKPMFTTARRVSLEAEDKSRFVLYALCPFFAFRGHPRNPPFLGRLAKVSKVT